MPRDEGREADERRRETTVGWRGRGKENPGTSNRAVHRRARKDVRPCCIANHLDRFRCRADCCSPRARIIGNSTHRSHHPWKKIEKKCFFLARGASKFFSDDRTKIRATVTCRARVLFSSPLAVSESPTRETPLHPARLPPSSRARRHVRAHRANVSRESSNEHARALPRAPSPRSTGATFFGVSPKFSGRPRGRDDGSHPHPSRRRQLAARRGRCLGTPHREVRHRPRGGRPRVPHPGPPQIRPQGSLAQSRRGAPSRG